MRSLFIWGFTYFIGVKCVTYISGVNPVCPVAPEDGSGSNKK
jgi:hypothetical protein